MTLLTTSGIHAKSDAPTPSRMPAAGSTATGSISALPTFWRKPYNAWNISTAPVNVVWPVS